VQPIETPHDREIGIRHRARQVINAAAADLQNFRLPGDRQIVLASIIALRSAIPPW
jgi:hypothetical protein